jgi:endonuclease YncB( thermonuclease family)
MRPLLRQPSSLLFWLIAVVIVAAVTQGVRELAATWRHGMPSWRQDAPARPGGTSFAGYARVVDGDSLEVAGESVRLHGIDAPERFQDCRDGNGRTYPCGRAAARALRDVIGGRAVACVLVDHDRYARDVARCSVDGRDLGEAMIAAGQAIELAQFSHGRYAGAESAARAAKRGLWAGQFEMPADWRRRHGH